MEEREYLNGIIEARIKNKNEEMERTEKFEEVLKRAGDTVEKKDKGKGGLKM